MRSLIYTPSGKAGEYANHGYAANLFKGCTHGCLYCYVPQFCKVDRQSFHAEVITAPDVLLRLEMDMQRKGQMDEPVFLCFTCDPYCKDADLSITRRAIEIINGWDTAVNILTKAELTSKDFDLLEKHPGNKIGATLTFYHQQLSEHWEPNASHPGARMRMLREASRRGIQTWASVEPVIIPQQSLFIMEAASDWVDEFKIGKWNHDKRSNDIDWPKFVHNAESLMHEHGKKYTLKQDLLRYKC